MISLIRSAEIGAIFATAVTPVSVPFIVQLPLLLISTFGERLSSHYCSVP